MGNFIPFNSEASEKETNDAVPKSINNLSSVLDLGLNSFSSISLWYQDLYLGSSDGKLFKANRIKQQ